MEQPASMQDDSDATRRAAEVESARQNAVFLALAGVLTAIVCVLILRHPFPLGVRGEWVWKTVDNPDWAAADALIRISLVLLIVVGVSAWAVRKLGALGEGALVAGLMLCVLLMHFMLNVVSPGGLRESFIAVSAPGASNLYHSQALEIDDVRHFLKYYRAISKDSQGWQLRTHPPGPTLFFWAIHEFYRECPKHEDPEAGGRCWEVPDAVVKAVLAVPEGHTPPVESVEEIRFLLQYSDRQKAAIWTAVLLLWVASASTIIPIYLWARTLYSKSAAIFAAAFTGVIPSLMLFGPLVDQLYPPLMAWTAYLIWTSIRKRCMIAACLAGVLVFVGMFFTLAFLAAGALAYLILFSRMVERVDESVDEHRRARQYALLGGASAAVLTPLFFIALSALPADTRPHTAYMIGFLGFVELGAIGLVLSIEDESGLWEQARELSPLIGAALVGFLGGAVLVAGLLGHDVLGSWKSAFEMNRQFNAATHRSFWAWMLANPLCYVTYLGVPVACLYLRRLLLRPCVITGAVLVLLLLLWASGQNLGEVERLWMFVMPLCAMTGAATLSAFGRYELPAGLALLAMQIAQLAVLKMCIQTVKLAG